MATTAKKAAPRARRKSNQADEAQLAKLARRSPYVLRLTRHKDLPPPVLVVKERIAPEDRDDTEGLTNPRAKHVERGTLHGELRIGLVEQVEHADGNDDAVQRSLGPRLAQQPQEAVPGPGLDLLGIILFLITLVIVGGLYFIMDLNLVVLLFVPLVVHYILKRNLDEEEG